MKRLTIMCLLFCVVIGAHAQQTIEISGTVTDSLGSVIKQAALVMVVDKTTLTKVAGGEYTGTFRIGYVAEPEKAYLLYAFVPGYKDRYMEITGKNGNLGKISLSELSQKLKEVVVKADALQHEVVFGDDVYKISGSVLANEYSLYTLLSRIPGLFVYGKTVNIVGAGTPTITINGIKPRPGELDMIRPDEIEKVKVSSIPSVKYSSNGVLDIRLKKKLRDYFSSYTELASMMKNRGGSTSPSIHVNNKFGKWVNYFSYNYGFTKSRTDTHLYNETYLDDEVDVLERNEKQKNRTNSHNFLISPKYQISPASFVDIQYNYSTSNQKGHSFSDGLHRNLSTDEVLGGYTVNNQSNYTHNIALRYAYDSSKGTNFVTNISYKKSKVDGNQSINETINEELLYSQLLQNSNNEVYTADMDYTTVLWKKLLFNVGGEYSYIKNQSETVYDVDDKYSGLTAIKDHVGVLYSSIRYVKKKSYASLGFRGEYNRRKDDYNLQNDYHKLQFIPILMAGYKLTKKTDVRLTYAFFNSYPNISQMNPAKVYINRFLYSEGNPYLKESKMHGLILDVKLPANISVKAQYRYLKDDIYQVVTTDEETPEVSKMSYININHVHKIIVSSNFMYSKNGYYGLWSIKYDQSFVKVPYLDGMVSYNKPYVTLLTQHNYQLNKKWSFGLNLFYRSRVKSFQEEQGAWYNASADVYYRIGKGWNMSLSAQNILYDTPQKERKYANVYNANFINAHERCVMLSISYRFNKYMDIFNKNESGKKAKERVD